MQGGWGVGGGGETEAVASLQVAVTFTLSVLDATERLQAFHSLAGTKAPIAENLRRVQ